MKRSKGSAGPSPAADSVVHAEFPLAALILGAGVLDGGEIGRIVGERTRQRRLALGLRQWDLAEAIGTHPQRISQYEQGGAPLAMSTLAKIARALGVALISFVK